MVNERSLPICSGRQIALYQCIADIQKPFQVWCCCSLELWQWLSAISLLTCSIQRLIGHGTSNSSRDLRPHRCSPRNDPWGWAQYCMSHLCDTVVGYLKSTATSFWNAWSQIKDDVDETGIDRLELLAGLVNTDADGRGWSGKATKKSRSCCCMHKAARLDDGLGD